MKAALTQRRGKIGINAFAYMVVARLVYFLGRAQKVLRIPATWLAKGFVSADVVCFLVQAVGGALMAGGQDNPQNADLGKKIYMVGCGIQLAFVLVFVVVVAAFSRDLSGEIAIGTAKTRNRWIRPLVGVIFLVLVLIVVSRRNPKVHVSSCADLVLYARNESSFD